MKTPKKQTAENYIKEIRRVLLDADVNFKIAKDFTTKVKEKAIVQNVLTSLQL